MCGQPVSIAMQIAAVEAISYLAQEPVPQIVKDNYRGSLIGIMGHNI